MSSALKKFISHIKNHCKEHNTKLHLSPWKSIRVLTDEDDEDCDEWENIEGYFVVPSRKKKGQIKVATGVSMSSWVHALAHEYAHFEYWIKHKKFRKNFFIEEKLTEKRALELLKEWKIPINIQERRKESRKYLKSLKD